MADRKWEYIVYSTLPLLPDASSPRMDSGQIAAVLDDFDERGWELVCHGEKRWVSGSIDSHWVFRRPFGSGRK